MTSYHSLRTFKAFYLLKLPRLLSSAQAGVEPASLLSGLYNKNFDKNRFQTVNNEGFLTPSVPKLRTLFLKLVESNQYLVCSGGVEMLYCLV